MVDKVDLKSMNITEDKKSKLKQLFPEVFKEGKIDFDKLKVVLGDEIEDKKERYEMKWAGKSKIFEQIRTPSVGTLRPCREESKNFDDIENIYIEGENLEVLKLLQKSYYNKIKMIYIDPPYNTGNDFVYKDDYKDNLKNYLEMTGQIDEEGKSLTSNKESSGRYHSDWLNMMYPRLFLARNLLKDDGAIFISIDDNEVHNLRKIMDEIFGEENFLLCGVANRPSQIASNYTVSKHEYFLVYSKDIDSFVLNGKSRYTISRGTVGNDDQTMPVITFPAGLECKGIEDGVYQETRKVEGSKENIENLDPIILEDGVLAEDVRLKARWRSSNDMRNFFDNDCQPTEAKINGVIEEIYFKSDRFMPWIKKKIIAKIPSTILENKRGSKDLENLGFSHGYDFPKSVDYIKELISYVASDDDIILDFFAGTGTTAESVLRLNEEDGNNRKFIMVQLPELYKEPIVLKDDLKLENISDLAKERIKRTINGYGNNEDIKDGFKVFKLDKSNFKKWDEKTEKLEKTLEDMITNIKEDRTKEDILYEIILKTGLKLDEKIEEKNINDKKVFSVMDDVLLICLEDDLDLEFFKEVARIKPARLVCLDRGFHENDQLKTNAAEIMKKTKYDGESSIEFKTV